MIFLLSQTWRNLDSPLSSRLSRYFPVIGRFILNMGIFTTNPFSIIQDYIFTYPKF